MLWLQAGAAEQLLERGRGDRFFQVVDGPVIHSLRDQDPLDLAALASGRLLVNRYLCRSHFAPSIDAIAVCARYLQTS